MENKWINNFKYIIHSENQEVKDKRNIGRHVADCQQTWKHRLMTLNHGNPYFKYIAQKKQEKSSGLRWGRGDRRRTADILCRGPLQEVGKMVRLSTTNNHQENVYRIKARQDKEHSQQWGTLSQ